ncbi:MAG: hypothetical protein NDI81_05925 [Desulfobacula sp.]|nr:hypothetical protein [Desulfobacula sp.]
MNRHHLENLTRALEIFPGHESFSASLAGILLSACEKDTITHDGLNQGKLLDFSDVLLFLWEWKFILPVRSAKCGEWDSRLLTAGPDEIFEMPHISRALVRKAARTGAWDSRPAIVDLFSPMDAGLLMFFFDHLAGRDFFVISGMMSPCPQRSLRTGLSFYEVSPVLFWGNPISI